MLECIQSISQEMIYIVLEYVESGSLLDHLKAKKNLPEQTAAQYLHEIAEALKYCNTQGVRVFTNDMSQSFEISKLITNFGKNTICLNTCEKHKSEFVQYVWFDFYCSNCA